MKPLQLKNGRWIVTRRENFVNWCAWRWWLARECGRGITLEKMCVWGEWPPETISGAQLVAQAVRDARREIQWDNPVCDPAEPWNRWSFNERTDLEIKHREDYAWNPDLPEFRGDYRRPHGQMIGLDAR